jgi:hypothetical protein
MDFKDADGASCQAWKRSGATPSCMCAKIETYFPKLSLEQTWAMLSNFEERAKWDEGMVDPTFLEKNDEEKSFVMHQFTPKPPVPILAQRDIVFRSFKIENVDGEGQHLSISGSIDHPSKPVAHGFLDYVRMVIRCGVIEISPNPKGNGTLFTEYRHCDL